MDIKIDDMLHDLTKDMARIHRKQIPFATAMALTKNAKKGQAAERKEMGKVFDRPSRFTLNATFVSPATKKDLKASVFLKDWAAKGNAPDKYLKAQIEGGQRPLKKFERLLRARGVLPAGHYAVPSKKARKDRYGNISKGLLNQIISYSGAQRDRYQNTKQGKPRQQKQKFILLDPKNGKPGGIWQMDTNSNLFPVLIFVKQTRYKKRYDFYGIANKVAKRELFNDLDAALKYAIATAR